MQAHAKTTLSKDAMIADNDGQEFLIVLSFTPAH